MNIFVHIIFALFWEYMYKKILREFPLPSKKVCTTYSPTNNGLDYFFVISMTFINGN